MAVIQIIFCLQYLLSLFNCDIPLVLKASDADIRDFPYAGFVAIKYKGEIYTHTCGSSILNQVVVLSAGHCFADCTSYTKAWVHVGHAEKYKGTKIKITAFMVHDGFNEMNFLNDIGIALMEYPVTFGPTVSRVALMSDPPYYEEAVVAGWGLLEEDHPVYARTLQYTRQQVYPKNTCHKLLHKQTPWRNGTICASDKLSIPSSGDSGSALVVRGYIQIGLVSNKPYHPNEEDKNLVVYTDTGYHLRWIRHAVHHLVSNCNKVHG